MSAEDAAAEDDDIFICIAPQNMNGHSIHGPLAAFCQAAGNRPVILINARLTDIPSANNVMSVRGRQERLDFEAEFEQVCCVLRSLTLSCAIQSRRSSSGVPLSLDL